MISGGGVQSASFGGGGVLHRGGSPASGGGMLHPGRGLGRPPPPCEQNDRQV